ncbi:MAG TPA: RNA polymerase sigma factor [Frankiaceae bacterium]|jgi:RNA polymerase sigma-70 factor (ECF subfamily)|nr:RNA polymerase sigma factor [Frankiaceae bacterium]
MRGHGDGPAPDFASWVGPHLLPARRLAARLAPYDAEDVLQDALTRAWRRRETFDPARGTVSAWLCGIVADQCRQRRRRERPDVETLPPAMRDDAAAVDVELAIRKLAPRQRQVVELHYFAGLPVADVAAALGISEGTVKSTLADARARLRDLLEVAV